MITGASAPAYIAMKYCKSYIFQLHIIIMNTRYHNLYSSLEITNKNNNIDEGSKMEVIIMRINKSNKRQLKNGFEYEPIVIETKNHRFEQNGKGYFYQLTTGLLLGTASAMALLVLVMCL